MIGTIIKENMEYNNISNKELALLMDISNKYLSEIVNERKDPSYELTVKMDRIFGFEEGDIYKFTNKYNELEELEENQDIKTIYERTFMRFKHFKNMAKISIYDFISNLFPTGNIDTYKKYLDTKSAAFSKNRDEPTAYLWTAIMEKKYGNIVTDNKFNKARAEYTFENSLKILFKENDINERIDELQDYLFDKGIVLRNSPLLYGSNLKGVTFKRGSQNYIFLTDKDKREYQYIFTFAHEFMHLYDDHNDNNKLVADRLKQFMAKNNIDHKELKMSFETYESGEPNEVKWDKLRRNTIKKVNFGDQEEFILNA